jgi:hypothetical protein
MGQKLSRTDRGQKNVTISQQKREKEFPRHALFQHVRLYFLSLCFLQDIRNSQVHRELEVGADSAEIHLLSGKIKPFHAAEKMTFCFSQNVYFLRKEQPSVSLALPPVGWQRTVEQPAQITTVWACEKTVVMVKQPGHLTSMKNDRGAGTRVYNVY